MPKRKKLYHGSPHRLDEIRPATATGKGESSAREKTSSVKHTLVTGHSGAGKSTLARSFGLPIHALDDDPDIREQLKFQMAYARENDGRLPLGEQYAKPMRSAEKRAIARALALKDPHVIEGSYLLNRDPEDFKTHNMHLVDTPESTVLDRRVERQRVKDIARNRHWDDERAKGVRMRGQQLINEYAPGVSRWRGADYVKKAALNKDVELRPHQTDALRALHASRGRALFAHGTGTGKTLTSIASFEDLRAKNNAKRALVVAPAALLTNFREQGVQKFTDSSVSAVGGDSDYQLVSLEKFRRDPQAILDKANADTLIIDEMHRSRNPNSSSFEALRTATRDKRIKNVIGLTGSIVSNHPQDIVPLADIIRDKHGLGSRGKFTKEHVKVKKISGGFLKPPSTKYDLHKKDALRGKVDGLIHYVGNNDMEGMPALKINDINVTMSKGQQKLYDFAMGKLNPVARARIRSGLPPAQSEAQHIFGMITKLRQASNSVGTHTNRSPAESAEDTPKLKRVLDDVQEHIKNTKDGQAVVYSNLVNGGAKELHEGLKARGIQAGLYTGPNKDLGVTKASRDEAVRRFTSSKDRAIILTGAGGEGLSLNNATMFAAVDPHFNPERNWQAIARARRFGGLAHRPKKDRVIQVNRYQSTPRQSFLGKAIFGKEVGVDEWMQRVADEKDRLNAQVRTISQNVTDVRKRRSESEHVKKAAAQSQEDIFRALKRRIPRGAHHVSGGLPDARGTSDVDIYLPRKRFRGLENRFPEGTSVVEQGDDYSIYGIPGFEREVNVYATSNKAKQESVDHRRTMMELAKKYPQLERKAFTIKTKGKGSEPAWAEVLGLKGDPYEVMANTEEVMRHASQIKQASKRYRHRATLFLQDDQGRIFAKKESPERGVKTASVTSRLRSIEIPPEFERVADRYYQTHGQSAAINYGKGRYEDYRSPRKKREQRMEDRYGMKTAEKGVAAKTDPAKWARAKAQARAKMGGKHSARAMQLATQIYKKGGGGYSGKKPSSGTNKLKKWTKQKWKWSGKDKPGQGGTGVYLPKRSSEQLKSTDSGRDKLRAAAAAKRAATASGRQFSSHGLHIGKKRSDVR